LEDLLMRGSRNRAWRSILLGAVLAAFAPVPVPAYPADGDTVPRSLPPELERQLLPSLEGESPALPARPGAPLRSPDGSNFTDVFSAEIGLDAGLPRQGAFDRAAAVLGRPGGPLCVVEIEDHALRSLRSTNGGASFLPEVTIAGGAGPAAVLDFAAVMAADGTIYAALVAADAAGDRALRFVRSGDGCQSWSPPQDLVVKGSAAHGVTAVAIAAGGTGFVSIAFVGRDGYGAYAMTSSNTGGTWNGPVRVDSGSGASSYAVTGIDVAADVATNRVLLAYAQGRTATSSIWYTRSTDGGATFAAEQNLDAVTANKAGSDLPTIEVVRDGVVLIAYWDAFNNNSVYVARSADGGATYAAAYDDVAGSSARRTPLVLAYDPAASAIQLAWSYNNSLWQTRSTDNGASFDPVIVLDVTADADPRGSRPIAPVSLARTPAGTWLLAWSDTRSDSYADWRSDIYLRRSTDEGATWLDAVRADSDVAGSAWSLLAGLATTGGDDAFIAWLDRRNGSGRDEDLYANRYVSGFGTDFRIDSDPAQVSAATLTDPVVATDGAAGVYVAFTARGDGHEMDIWVARSGDGGYTFAVPVRVGSTPAGQRVQLLPYLAATPDGNVYLAYCSDDPATGQRELRFSHSSTFGATWAADRVLDSWTQPAGYFVTSFDFPNVQLRAVNGGAVYIAWSDNVDVFLARSFDGGITFDTRDVDQDSRGYNRYPALCAQGNQLVLATMSPKQNTLSYFSIWGTVSNNRGDTWSTRAQLRPEATSERGIFPVAACDGTDKALVTWMDLRNGSTYALRANRWTGSAWGGDVAVSGPAGVSHYWPQMTYAGTSTALIAFQDLSGSVYAARSADGGATFPSYQRLDNAAPDPAAISESPRIASDGNDAFFFWLERSAGDRSVVVRETRDGGSTYGSVRRVNREQPQGAFFNQYYLINATAAALTDVAFVSWAGVRGDGRRDALVNAHDLDDPDRDTWGLVDDCDDADAGVWRSAVEVSGVVVSRLGTATARIAWSSQDASAGPATRYDVVSGLLSELRAAAGFTGAGCLANDLSDTPHDDTRGAPPLANGHYYLVRAANTCNVGTYGDSGQAPDPRDLLDSAGPCP
jgi:hypothetical protein